MLLRKFIDGFITVIIGLSVCLLAVGAVLYAINSILRTMSLNVAWIEEYSIYSLVLVVFLMQSKLEFRDEQLSISILADKVKNKPIPRRIIFSIKGVITIAVYAVLFQTGLTVIKQNLFYGVVSPILAFPMGLYFVLVNICLALVVIYWIIHIFTKRWNPYEESEGFDNV